MKLELGSGERPTPGYIHQDIVQLSIPLDYVCKAWEVSLESGSIDEVIALGVMEHLRFDDFRKTLRHIYRLLKPEGIFLFDVPDITIWSEYLYKILHGLDTPFEKKHIFATMWGWQRWEGDEHKSAWTRYDLNKELSEAEFKHISSGLLDIKKRGIKRNRFNRPEDAHIYIKAIK